MKPSNTNRNAGQDEEWNGWAAAAQQGDKRAYAALLKGIAPFIRGMITGGLANADWADDIVQEVLISVHKSLHTWSPDRPFRPWLAAIASFRKADFLRRHYGARGDRKISLDDADFSALPVTDPAHAGELKDIEDALASLPDKQRKVFELMKIKGYSASEVASEMGMTVTAVKVSAHRAAAKLKEALG